jgi:hypothetical protein
LLGVERWLAERLAVVLPDAERPVVARLCEAATLFRPGFRSDVRGECERVAIVIS